VTDPIDKLRAALEGRYAVERLIGEGGMATVYLAHDARHDRPVAIKVLRAELAASIGADRFLREIRVAARLQHPNILALYDSGEAAGFLYYVMPFVKGESLRARLDREQQLSLPDAIGLTCEIAEALHCAHGQEIVHRDIKPENILLHEGHALVADFGIARAAAAAGGDKLTETGMAVGTPHYMSPEQGLGGERVDGRADQYSLGCMLYEMLVGEPPFKGPNAMAILARHSMEVVPSLQVVRSSIPDEVEDAIMRSLEKTPADRFPTIREFADALAEVDLGPQERRSSRSIRARRTSGNTGAVRRRTSEMVAAERPSIPARIIASTRERGARFWSIAAGALVLVAAGLSWAIWFRPGDASTVTSDLSPNRIAVMYFQKATGSSDSLGYLADGITEALIHELSEVPQLHVVSRAGVSPYRNAAVAPDSVGRALKVGTLVQGSVAGSSDRLRVSVSLINAANSQELGSKTLERPRQEIFALQDDVAREVSLFLRERLGQEIKVQEIRVGTRNPQAWELLQQAGKLSKDVDPLLAAGDTAGAARRLNQADSILAGVERMDPTWVTPVVERGWVTYRQTDLIDGFDKALYSKWTALGIEHADRALQLKPGDPDALELRGILRYWRWLLNLEPAPAAAKQLIISAEQDLRAAVNAKPTAARAWTYLSHLLVGQGQTAEAKLAAVRSYEADPYLSSAKQTLYSLYSASFDLEDQVEATHWCEEGKSRFPDYYRFAECELWLMGMKGQTADIDKAWQVHERFVRLTPANLRPYYSLYGNMIVGWVLARGGKPDSARSLILRSRGDAATDATRDLAYYEALVRIQLGDKDEALKLLSTYVAANPQRRDGIAKDDSWTMRDLRSDPRFATLFGKPSQN
jgi:TolB-like protein/tRNA A-37 threonylcarbamoyl transferase component Bud32/tetratricopeptide (TPR) repeat protein